MLPVLYSSLNKSFNLLFRKLENNIEKIHCKFVNEGKATVVLKEPNFTLILQKVFTFDCKKVSYTEKYWG